MLAVAITGGIATGKSTVTQLLSRYLADGGADPGWHVFSADAEARRLTEANFDVKQELRASFGGRLFDEQGNLSRAQLRSIVFADSSARKKLEEILHPRIRAAWRELLTSPQSLLAEIPLLFETGADASFPLIIAVACSRTTQKRRLEAERQLHSTLADSMIDAQMPLTEKIERAHRLIWTDCPKPVVEAQTERLAAEILR